MFSDKTLLILGAGASFEVGLPLGDTLKKDISNSLKVSGDSPQQAFELGVSDRAIHEAIICAAAGHQSEGKARWEMLKTCERISAALPLARSIDNYLHSHRNSEFFELCGKLGIVRCILAAEGNSKMALEKDSFDNPRLDFGNLNDTWYNRFAGLLFESDYDEFVRRLANLDVIGALNNSCIMPSKPITG